MRFRLVLISLASTALYAALAVRPDPKGAGSWALWAALVVLYAAAVHGASGYTERSYFAIIFIGAVLFRGALLLGSGLDGAGDDVFLYGSSPLTTLAARLDVGFTVERVVVIACDLGALALAPSLLKAARIPVGAAIIHGWNPLVVTEVAGNARLEILAFVLLLLALRLLQTNARWAAALVYGASLAGPLVLVAALPLFAKAVRARLVLGLGLALLAWEAAFPGMRWIERAGWPPDSHLGGSAAPSLAAVASLFVTRNEVVPIAILFAAWAVMVVVRLPRGRQPPLEALVAVGTLVLVSPQVLPWAFVLFAYLGAYSTNRGWIAFTATAPLTYAAIEVGSYSFWLGFAQYFVPYALTIYWWLGPPSSPPAAAGSKAK